MGIVSGSLSISRYRILSKNPLSQKILNKNLQKYVGNDLLSEGVKKELEAAWVMPSGTIAAGEERDGDYWDLADCELGENILLKLRIEKRKVPGELLNLVAKKEIAQISDSRGKRVSKPEQKEIKELIKEELTGQALPQVSYIDVVWKPEEKEVWLLSTAKTTRTIFEELFIKTFLEKGESTIVPIGAPLLGLSENDWEGDNPEKLDTLFNIVPTGAEATIPSAAAH